MTGKHSTRDYGAGPSREQPRRAAFVLNYPSFGGPHNRVRTLQGPLSEAGWEVTLILPTEPGDAARQLIDAGVHVVQVPLSRFRRVRDPRVHIRAVLSFPTQVVTLTKLFRTLGADVIVLGTLVPPHAAVAARFARIPLLWHIVDSQTPKLILQTHMVLVRALADTVLFGANSLIAMHVGGRPLVCPVRTAYPSVDMERFHPNSRHRENVRRELQIDKHADVVGTVANLNPTKGIEYFVRAAKLVAAKNPETRFVVVGSASTAHSDYRAKLFAERDAAGLRADQFQFVEARADVERYYPAFDVFVVSSVPRSEGTTTTAMEALACEVPVVATRVGGLHEVVIDGVNGHLVPPQNPTALAAGISTLLKDRTVRAQFGKAGREHVEERFSVIVSVDTYRAAFEAAIEWHSRRQLADESAVTERLWRLWRRRRRLFEPPRSDNDGSSSTRSGGGKLQNDGNREQG